MHRFLLITLLALFFVGLATAQARPVDPANLTIANLTVVVENLRSDSGEVRIALWSGAEGFTEPEDAVAETGQSAKAGQVTFTFSGLPPGRYAIASFHDENGNGSFDRTFLGLPKEGLGFSNGAWIGLGPPTFDEAAVDVAEPDQVIVVKLRY